MVKIKTKCRIQIWRTFGRIQWHAIPKPPATLQGAATWWIHCHDYRATCYIAGCSHLVKSMSWSCHIAGCKIFIRHIENRLSPYFIFYFIFFLNAVWALMSGGFRIVSDTLVLASTFLLGGVLGSEGQEPDLHRIFAFQWDMWRRYGRISMKFYASKITEKRVHGFEWNVSCREMSEHGRTI